MITLNENKLAYDIIQEHNLGKKPSETLCLVAKYYIWNQGLSRRNTKKMVTAFLIQSTPMVSVPKWEDTINYAITTAAKYKPVEIDGINITVEEMSIISTIKNKQAKRLAFTLLCLSKYWDVLSNSQNHWVNTKDTDIMRMANVKTSMKRQSMLYHTLNQMGLIQFSRKVDNTNVQVLFQTEGETAITITDMRNLGYQYMAQCGESYFVCENCGIMTKDKDKGSVGAKRKYCPDCADKVRIQQTINTITNKRQEKVVCNG